MAARAQLGHLHPPKGIARDLGAAVIGLWYWIVLGSGLSEGIRNLAGMSGNNGWTRHYVLFSAASLVATGLAAIMAASSAPHPKIVTLAIAVPQSLVFLLPALMGRAGSPARLPALAFGYAPTAIGFLSVLAIATLGVGALSGFAPPRDGLDRVSPWQILEVRAGHWGWLWIPAWFWAALVPPLIYLVWLDLVLGWHWLIHPSLWLSWRWWVFFSFGIGLSSLPQALFFTSTAEAFDSLASTGRPLAARLGRFLIFGVGLSIVGVILAIALSFWILGKLPVVATHTPWWAPFFL